MRWSLSVLFCYTNLLQHLLISLILQSNHLKKNRRIFKVEFFSVQELEPCGAERVVTEDNLDRQGVVLGQLGLTGIGAPNVFLGVVSQSAPPELKPPCWVNCFTAVQILDASLRSFSL